MKRNIFLFIVCIVIISLLSFDFVYAYTGNFTVAGKIKQAEAMEIEQAEDQGYVCDDNLKGKTITVSNVINGTLESYLIPLSVVNKSGKSIVAKKWILGLYSTATDPITCTNGESEKIFYFKTITLYGTS